MQSIAHGLVIINMYVVILDVNDRIYCYIFTHSYIQSMNSSTASISFPNGTCNISKYTILDISRLSGIKTFEIGNDCFESVKTFQIDGLNQLKTIKIGNNSFTQKRYWYGNDKSKSFHILNCESLESIQIGEYSFSDFGGECELKNLPQLQSIQIGTIERYSYNFFDSSFVLRGIDMILNTVMIRSS